MQNNLLRLLAFAAISTISLVCQAREAYNCVQCHTSTSDVAVHAIFHSAHGNIASKLPAEGEAITETEKPNLACVACHGASSEHQSNPIANSPEISFGPRWQTASEQKDAMCLSCHAKGKTMMWLGSEHQNEDLNCNSCHVLHTQVDTVLHKKSEAEVCFSCHSQQRTQARLPSHHPITEGKTVCSDCHNPHGSSSEFSLTEVSLNDTCFSCHAEKRGPFLFEHAPAAEDCSTCHDAHGTVNDNLLTTRGPFLCQQCHMASFHPSTAFSGLDVETADQNVAGKNCLNCHSQIHGSNHPSGAFLTR